MYIRGFYVDLWGEKPPINPSKEWILRKGSDIMGWVLCRTVNNITTSNANLLENRQRQYAFNTNIYPVETESIRGEKRMETNLALVP
jgi:hypothetical protein